MGTSIYSWSVSTGDTLDLRLASDVGVGQPYVRSVLTRSIRSELYSGHPASVRTDGCGENHTYGVINVMSVSSRT